ncbi:hypothetical protein FSW04_25415 [Baekduia soli]|uniref:Uncharacterized protein n=1 Tax=Baekduia soli TaxID=496014 RepID=A0A5B8TZF9_9ACTN|nr:hypothetical protein [Baekduia soli]QEC46112.1 hypothetical protein FSW04_00060 [Baekduia soli]QEC50593.1 hypothetical protein FSW04_25415 [Baekduia soli]
MGISGPSGSFTDPAAAQMQWDAIASIKSVSPFAEPAPAGGAAGGIAAALDSLMPQMPAVAGLAGDGGQAGGAGGIDRDGEIRRAQQVTIDLFA